jgi:hypothetical protein
MSKLNLYLGFTPAKQASPIRLVVNLEVPSKARTEARTACLTYICVWRPKCYPACMDLCGALRGLVGGHKTPFLNVRVSRLQPNKRWSPKMLIVSPNPSPYRP